MNRSLSLVVLLLPLSAAVAGPSSPTTEPPPVYEFRIVASYPHDPEAFTQGLVYHNGFLYESVGRDAELRKVQLKTGEVLQRVELADRYFGEGLALSRGRLVQLTWKAKTGFVYDLQSFERLDTFSYVGQGWGLTTNGHYLIMSDGSNTLTFLDPETFEVHRRMRVVDGADPVDGLNELEYVRGEVYANVYPTSRIARIDPGMGQVVGWIDLERLANMPGTQNVLNGIAYDSKNNRLFVTGKLWHQLFQIKLVSQASANSAK